MPKVMIRRNEGGDLTLYVPKKDLEDTIVGLQHDGPNQWGGEVTLANGSRFMLDVLDSPPNLPVTLRARRAGE